MPTYSFTRTREELRDKILRKLGAAGDGQTPSAEDAMIVYEGIDLRLKELHALGILWYQVSGAQTDVALTASTVTANAPTDCLFPVTMAVRIDNEDNPLEIIGHRVYQAIPNKTETGEPEMVYFSGGVFRFWPVPDANYTAKLTYQAIAADSTAGAAIDLETAMIRAFSVIVAHDLVDDFGLPESKIVRLRDEAAAAMRTIRALNPQRVESGTTTVDYF
jgi:hypothetical protein